MTQTFDAVVLFGSDVEWTLEVPNTTSGTQGWQLWSSQRLVHEGHSVVAAGHEKPQPVVCVPVADAEHAERVLAALVEAGLASRQP